MQRINPPRHRTPRCLERLIRTHQHRCPRRAITLRANQPIAKPLPQRIIHAIENVKENRPRRRRRLLIINILLQPLRKALILPDLKSIATAPDRHSRNEEHGPSDLCSCRAREGLEREVEDVPDEQPAHHLRHPIQRAVERARADVECEAVDVVLLVGVEDIGAEEEREHEHDSPFEHDGDSGLDCSGERVFFGFDGGVELCEADA